MKLTNDFLSGDVAGRSFLLRQISLAPFVGKSCFFFFSLSCPNWIILRRQMNTDVRTISVTQLISTGWALGWSFYRNSRYICLDALAPFRSVRIRNKCSSKLSNLMTVKTSCHYRAHSNEVTAKEGWTWMWNSETTIGRYPECHWNS